MPVKQIPGPITSDPVILLQSVLIARDFKVIDQIASKLVELRLIAAKAGDQANHVPIPKFNFSSIQFCNLGWIP